MFAQVHSPESLTAEELDAYLEKGWFRMGQTIFTTNFLHFKDQFYSAVWLRVVLAEFVADKTQQKLLKMNSGFRTEIKPASLNPVKEALYTVYKQAITFEASPSLSHLLFGKSAHAIYNTIEVNICDGDKLIAAGFFDLGATSAAGITCFYDPDYKKYSLGKYLIYLKMEYCKNLGLHYFYPGYFVPGYAYFDYKLNIAKAALQYFQFTSQQWLPLNSFSAGVAPLELMEEKLLQLQSLLIPFKLESRLLRYEFFDANLIPELRGAELFDFPMFLCFTGSMEETINHLIVYDVSDQRYHLLKCRGVWKTNTMNGTPGIYSSYALKLEQDLFTAKTPEEFIAVILMEMKLQANEQ